MLMSLLITPTGILKIKKKRRDLLPNSKIWPTRVCAYPPIYEGTYTDISSSGYMWDTIWAVPLSAENIEKII
jgi:hypothetical protein